MRPIATDTNDFPSLRRDGKIYVDKTGFVFRMVTDRDSRLFFMSRPRRFGKSLTLSVLKALFSGAFYADGDIREIVEYARARHISVVPEIDFPGHFGAVRRAYPQFACPGGKPMCVGNEEAVAFAENVLDRACELFPGVPIHIGGDECSRKFWGKCPKCLELVKREGLSGVEEIQPWLTRRLAKRLSTKGRRAVGWDEIAVGPKKRDGAAGGAISAMFPKTALVMGRWPDALATLANAGCEVVRCDYPHCYFDYSQAVPGDRHGYFGKLKTPLEKVYAFNPFDGIRTAARANVLGGECCNWTERTADASALDWKLWPRALALSEILWTNPDPAKRDFAEFSARAAEYRRRLIREHVNCAPLK